MKGRSKSLIKNTSILAFGTLCTKGIMFIMTPLFTRWLTVDEYGSFDLLITYTSLLIPFLTLASGEAVFRFLIGEDSESKKTEIISTVFFMYGFGACIELMGSIIVGSFFYTNICIVLAFDLYFLTELFYNFMMMAMRGEKRTDIYTLGSVVFVLALSFFVGLFVFVFDLGLVGILLGYSIGNICAIFFILDNSKIYKMIKLKECKAGTLKKISKYSFPLISNSVSWWIMNVSDRSLISFFLGTNFNAIYAVANKVPSLCESFFGIFHLSWQQNATETMSDKDRDQYYCNVLNNMISIIGSICILILGINYWFFVILFENEYFEGYYQAPVLVLAVIFSMLSQFIGGIYVAHMESEKNGITTIIAAMINVVINLLLIKKCGLYAASISTLIAYFSLFVIRYMDIKKSIKIRFHKKNYLLFALLFYIIFSSYFQRTTINVINLFLGFFVFGYINAGYTKQISKSYIKRRNMKINGGS